MSCAIFALMEYDVSCACYSDYLSARDYEVFKEFFINLGVDKNIRYGTFNKLCEEELNSDKNIRETVLKYIEGSAIEAPKKKDQRPKILFIDEVDVFFSQDFYGALFTPSAKIKDSSISELLKYVWTQRKAINFNTALKSAQFIKCVERFPKWGKLFQEALKDIVSAAKQEIIPNYFVKNDKIGYKDQDTVLFNIFYGYSTTFTYFLENEKGNITSLGLEENLAITIKVGNFSYAEIPKKFDLIMGVTGTLESLSQGQKNILATDFQIKKQTFVPSVFGKNNRKFSPRDDLLIEEENTYFETIRKQIAKNLDNRAVLVVFQDEKRLREFYESPNFDLMRDKAAILTESADAIEKKSFVSRATLKNNISLMTRCFGRGTDFLCQDETVVKAGGLHCIITFLSEELSEEVQIKGRVARQGDDGSYSMVLSIKDLEYFLITQNDLPVDDRYDFLNKKRTDFFEDQNKEYAKFIKISSEEHSKSLNFLDALDKDDLNVINNYLCELNHGASQSNGISSRTIVMMDATGSMSNLLQKAKTTVNLMFTRAKQVLKDNGMNSDCFEIQLVFYRNYSSGSDKILVSSPWESNPSNLKAFMDKINVGGGMGAEAVEIGLWHANQEASSQPITQVILIGDAPANSQQEVIQRRQHCSGENYWLNSRFKAATTYADEVKKLKSQSIKVHSFYVANYAKTNFEEIANATGGVSFFLDVNNAEKGAKLLTDSVTIEILKDVGKATGTADVLVNAYKKAFT